MRSAYQGRQVWIWRTFTQLTSFWDFDLWDGFLGLDFGGLVSFWARRAACAGKGTFSSVSWLCHFDTSVDVTEARPM
jgi:hypothetical protein